MRRPILANICALAAAFVVIVAVTALWIVSLRLGPRLDGFSGGAMVIMMPIALFVLTAIWIVLRALFRRNRVFAAWIAFAGGAVIALVAVVANCGPTACFVPGNERLMGWFAVGGTGLAALVHHLVLARFAKETGHAHAN